MEKYRRINLCKFCILSIICLFVFGSMIFRSDVGMYTRFFIIFLAFYSVKGLYLIFLEEEYD